MDTRWLEEAVHRSWPSTPPSPRRTRRLQRAIKNPHRTLFKLGGRRRRRVGDVSAGGGEREGR